MAQYRLSAQVIGRSSGRSATAAAAYRAAEHVRDFRTGEAHDYTRKSGVIHTEIMAPEIAPAWAGNRQDLWNAVEAMEKRKDAQLAREIELSLPHELTFEKNREMVRSFVREQFVSQGMIADLAIHAPHVDRDQRNIHAHVMLTMRRVTQEGFGPKVREWNSREQLEAWREAWATHQNCTFESLGLDVRVDHRSYERQDINREPTHHLGPAAAEMERQGRQSRKGQENREAQARNRQREQTERRAEIIRLEEERERRRVAERHETARIGKIEDQRARFQAWASQRRESLARLHTVQREQAAQERQRSRQQLQARIERLTGAERRKMEAEGASILKRQQAGFAARVLHYVTGQQRRDQVALQRIDNVLSSIRDQTAKMEAWHREREKKQGREFDRAQYAERSALELRITRAQVRRAARGWQPDRFRVPLKVAANDRKQKQAKPMPYSKDGTYIDPTAPEARPQSQPERPRDPGPSHEAQKAAQVLPEPNRTGLDAKPLTEAAAETRGQAWREYREEQRELKRGRGRKLRP